MIFFIYINQVTINWPKDKYTFVSLIFNILSSYLFIIF